jgi:hypothetical protein
VNSLGAKALFDAAIAQLDERLLASRGWIIHSKIFPVLDISFRDPARQELRIRLECDDWNDSPPSVALLAPDGTFLTALPTPRPGNNIFNPTAHDRTKRPFVCMIGSREYHEHASHLNDLWINYKAQGNYTLGNIIEQLWNGWLRVWP